MSVNLLGGRVQMATFEEVNHLLNTLFPILRSLTGDGNRQTLSCLARVAGFGIHEIPSGTRAYDWVVPDEWNVREAYIEDLGGNRIVDFRRNNLHLVSYSEPIDRVMPFRELKEHLHTLPHLPDAIPYRTSYYHRDWGFSLTHSQLCQLDTDAHYHVVIDSTLAPGGLTMGEAVLPGRSGREFLISTYCCHPSLANDNLSGLIVWALLLRELRSRTLYHTYRFVVVPETIGAIAYLSMNEEAMRQVSGGFVLTTVGGPGRFGYKETCFSNHLIDRITRGTFRELKLDYVEYPFDVNGSDERQYSSPFFRIPIGTISKDKYYEYSYYHTSLDDLKFVSAENLLRSLDLYLAVVENLEVNRVYRSLHPYGEPMLSKRRLYSQIGGRIRQQALDGTEHRERAYALSEGSVMEGARLDALLWLMHSSDGRTPLLDIAERSRLSLRDLHFAAEELCANGLLQEVGATEEI